MFLIQKLKFWYFPIEDKIKYNIATIHNIFIIIIFTNLFL